MNNTFFSKKKLFFLFLLFFLFILLATLLVGLRSGARQDLLYIIARNFKNKIFNNIPLKSYGDVTKEILFYEKRQKEFVFNNYNQLILKYGQIEVDRPVITPRTIIAFVFGQSNSANHGGEKFFSNSPNVINYYDKKFYLASDPLLGATGISGNVWTNLGNKIIENNIADKVILIAAGISGTSAELWSKYNYLYPMLENRLEDAKINNLDINYFFWHQGESDINMNSKRYENYLEDVINLTKKFFPNSKFVLAQVSSCGILESSEQLLKAQKNLTKIKNVYLGPNTDFIDYRDRYDGCHFSGRGLERHSQGWFETIINLPK